MVFTQARRNDVTFAQIPNSGRAQMLNLPKEGRPNLPDGYRTSNRTQRGKDHGRKGAQPSNALDAKLFFCVHRVSRHYDPVKVDFAIPEVTCVDH
jgi:hypothetical protein